MKSIAMLVLVSFAFALAGCASSPDSEAAYYAMVRAEMSQPQDRVVEIVAQPGEQITGLQSVTVYAPRNRGAVQQYRPPPNEFLRFMNTVATLAIPMYFGGKIITDSAEIMAGVTQGAFNYTPPVTGVEVVNPLVVRP